LAELFLDNLGSIGVSIGLASLECAERGRLADNAFEDTQICNFLIDLAHFI
jgi:hypothetical protein